MTSTFDGGIKVGGDIRYTGLLKPDVPRSNLAQTSLAKYFIPWHAWRVWNALATNLPGTPLTDDLGLVGGTWATGSPSIQTEALEAAGATPSYARCQIALPPEYDEGQDVVLRFHAGMLTSVADTSATLDVVAYESDGEAGIGSDLVTTAATTINSLTLADKDFVVTASGLSPGDILDIRIHTAVNDGASGTAVKAIIGAAYLLCDIRG